eukprot:1022-Heterococcus_DN1.PRE.7
MPAKHCDSNPKQLGLNSTADFSSRIANVHICNRFATADIMRPGCTAVGCKEMGRRVAEALEKLL